MPYVALCSDTSPEAERVQLDLLRRAPAWRKLEVADQLNQAVRLLAVSGLRQRHPGASEGDLRRLLAELILGRDLARRVYGSPRDS